MMPSWRCTCSRERHVKAADSGTVRNQAVRNSRGVRASRAGTPSCARKRDRRILVIEPAPPKSLADRGAGDPGSLSTTTSRPFPSWTSIPPSCLHAAIDLARYQRDLRTSCATRRLRRVAQRIRGGWRSARSAPASSSQPNYGTGPPGGRIATTFGSARSRARRPRCSALRGARRRRLWRAARAPRRGRQGDRRQLDLLIAAQVIRPRLRSLVTDNEREFAQIDSSGPRRTGTASGPMNDRTDGKGSRAFCLLRSKKATPLWRQCSNGADSRWMGRLRPREVADDRQPRLHERSLLQRIRAGGSGNRC